MTRAQRHNQESKVRDTGDEMVMRRSDFFKKKKLTPNGKNISSPV